MPVPWGPRISRRSLLAGPLLAAGSGRRPNIVFILADDLGWGDLGCYGQRYIRTPNLDRLAREGTRFTDAYAGCTVCAPSRSVLMTGLHMGHTPVRANSGGIPLLAEHFTVAELLAEAGYRTGCFGKWGLGDIGTEGVPWKQGFEEFFGYLHQVHAHFYYPPYLWENDRKFYLEENRDGRRGSYSHDLIAARALEFIRRHRSEPFFCYVAFTIPHWELLVPEDSLAEYQGKIPEAEPYRDPRRHYADQPLPRATYAAMVTRMDCDVGRFVGLLAELGLERDTVVFFSSDNGAAERLRKDEFFSSYGPFRGHKQTGISFLDSRASSEYTPPDVKLPGRLWAPEGLRVAPIGPQRRPPAPRAPKTAQVARRLSDTPPPVSPLPEFASLRASAIRLALTAPGCPLGPAAAWPRKAGA